MNYDHISQIGEDNATHAHRETCSLSASAVCCFLRRRLIR